MNQDDIDEKVRKIKEAATARDVARLAAVFFRALVKERLTRKESLALTKVWMQAVMPGKDGRGRITKRAAGRVGSNRKYTGLTEKFFYYEEGIYKWEVSDSASMAVIASGQADRLEAAKAAADTAARKVFKKQLVLPENIEFPDDVNRMLQVLNDAGYEATPAVIQAAYQGWSEATYPTGWYSVERMSDERLLEILLAILAEEW